MHLYKRSLSISVLLSSLVVFASACSGSSPADEDSGTGTDAGDETSTDAGGDAAPDATDSGTDSGDGGGDTKPCDATKAPSDDPCVLKDDLGVFVSSKSGNDEFPGTKVKPLKTIAKALAAAKARGLRVYACAEEFAENVTLVDGVDLFGGVDCVGGAVGIAGQTTLKPTASPALTVENTTKGVRVENVLAQAPNGSGTDVNSIAMIARNAKAVVLRNVTLIGGDAARGADGSQGTFGTAGAAGSAGGDSAPCLPYPASGKGGGASPNKGGDGGDAGCGPFKGDHREPTGGTNAGNATGSFGIGGTPALSTSISCKEGNSGKPGVDGTPGVSGGELGSFTTTYVPSNAGTDGTAGTNGSAGGGGGAGYYSTLVAADPGSIYSGGAGGAGGAGATGGAGSIAGKGGGGSFALISLDSDIELTTCSLSSGKGGKGGLGFDKTPGGAGGKPGDGGASSGKSSLGINDTVGCRGGVGGAGGFGGPSGGGGGGPSIVIAFKGTAPKRTAGDLKVGTGGDGGAGGAGVAAAPKGKTAETLEIK